MNLEELCRELKRKREERGLTIEHVVEKTKLYPSAIRDIEDANIASINPTYLKGFLKIYAAFLNVPLENALDEIAAFNKPKKERKERKENTAKIELKPFVFSAQLRRVVIAAVGGIIFLILLVSFIRFIIMHFPRPVKPTAKPVVSRQVVVTPQKPVSRDVTVSLTAKRACYVRAKVDGKVIFSGTLSRGKVATWKALKELEFRISDGSAVYLEVNGKTLPPLTSMRKTIKSLKVTSAGISVSK